MQQSKSPLTAKTAFNSLKEAGYPQSFVKKLMPEWWDNSLLKTSAGVLQFALILKQKLGINANFSKDGTLTIPTEVNIEHVSFKRRLGTGLNELNVATNIGIAASRIALISTMPQYSPLPNDSQKLHEMVCEHSGKEYVDYEGLLDFCWACGIPVLFLKDIPRTTKKMTGMAVIVDERPAILLGFNYAQFSKQLFVLAHELGHIVSGHVENNGVLVDEDILDITEGLEGRASLRRDEQEREADAFALSLLRNNRNDVMSHFKKNSSSAVLAATAHEMSKKFKIDPGHLILSYAKENDDWIRANQALNFITQRVSAIDLMKEKFIAYSDLTKISEESNDYILSIQGFIEH